MLTSSDNLANSIGMKKSPLFLILSFVIVFLSNEEAIAAEGTYDNPVVTLSHGGKVKGKVVTVTVGKRKIRVKQFLGIPYGKEPTGRLRFARSEKVQSWSDTKDALNLPPTCWQYIYTEGFEVENAGARMWINNTQMNEDCLYLNVWVPDGSESKTSELPVMVWIYGGGFVSGTSTLDVYDGSILAGTQNVIVVSIQYRVGAFGFLSFDATNDKDQVALGNQGLHDQKLALEWVQDNIELFGGDKDSVTIFGESAGAVSVSIFWVSAQTQHLFKRAIMESSSIYARWAYTSREEANKRGKEFIKACGCDRSSGNREEILDCMRQVSPETLVDKIQDVTNFICEERRQHLSDHLSQQYQKLEESQIPICSYFDAPFGPVQDEYFVPKDIDKAIRDRATQRESQLLIGVNKNEGMYFVLYGLSLNDVQFFYSNGTVDLPEKLKEHMKNNNLLLATIAQFISQNMMTGDRAKRPAYFYDLGHNATGTAKDIMQRLDKLSGDLDFTCPTLNFADKVSENAQASVYMYNFEKRTRNFTMPPWVGVMHGYEIEYVFGMPWSQKFQERFYGFGKSEEQVSENVMKMWADFARTGNPTPKNRMWPLYKESKKPTGQFLNIDDKLKVMTGLRQEGCDFWSKFPNES